jgi:hypothetical protein
MNDTEEEWAWGTVLEIEEQSQAWARVQLDGGRIVTAHDPALSGRRDATLPGGMLPGDRVSILLLEGYCLIFENARLTSHDCGPGPPHRSVASTP